MLEKILQYQTLGLRDVPRGQSFQSQRAALHSVENQTFSIFQILREIKMGKSNSELLKLPK